MQLIVAEKPSVARDLARVLGVRPTGARAFEGGARVITWCVGHLVELEEPAAYDARWASWRMDTLPMLPGELRLRAAGHARDQLAAVTALLRERRFTQVVNACDAGREGELIFRYVYQHAGARIPIVRLWISSLTDEAIRRGFAALQSGARFDALADAARSRSEADWLVGMNATRALTVRGRTTGGRDAPLASVGRVQTPTLAMLVARERAVRAFVPRDYWEIRATLRTAAGERVVAGFRVGAIARVGVRAHAEAIAARDRAHAAAGGERAARVERVRGKTVQEPPPLLFDLTALQRTANRRFGFSAARTLEIAQALYERHKLLTYPRTDSRHLTSDLVASLPALFDALGAVPDYAPFVAPLHGAAPRPGRRVVDDAKVHDHHAIIPTGHPIDLGALDRDARRVFDLVARRFIGAFHPAAEFAATEVWIRVGPGAAPPLPAVAAPRGERPAPAQAAAAEPAMLAALPPEPDRYLARGRVRVVAGWQAVAGIGPTDPEAAGGERDPERDAGRDGDGERAPLPALTEGQVLTGDFAPIARQTTPPPRYTEATLLGAMETAGQAIEDEALRAAMKEHGLGTPATRAAIIETLVRRRYVERARQSLVPTASGMALVAHVESLAVASLASPELTGAWEARLARIARGDEGRAAFMADIARYVTDVVAAIRASSPSPSSSSSSSSSPSPSPSPSPSKSQATPKRARSPRVRAPIPIGTDTGLSCPRCARAHLITGARGWGCARWRDGCTLVIPFEVKGRRLTPAKLRALVARLARTPTGRGSSPSPPSGAGR